MDTRTDKVRRTRSKNEHLTIGLVCDHLYNRYNINMWRGVRDAVWEHGANLIYFSSGMLRDPQGFNSQANVLYDLANKENLDGLVLWGAQLTHHTTIEELRMLCERYRPLPIVNIGLALEGIPSLLVNNHQGMHDQVTHLIEAHGHRRIAYICGPGDASEVQERYRGYADALVEHGIPLDVALVVTGSELVDESLKESSSLRETGIRILLDKRKLQPRVDFEALVGHDDDTGRLAMNILQARGFRVPADVAVASFDDIRDSRYLTPPLTTARQSFYDLGRRGAEMLLAQLSGEEVPEQVVLPMKVMVRQSCGCGSPAVAAAGETMGDRSSRVADQKRLQTALAGEREKVVAEMAREVGDSEQASRWAEQVLDGFVAALTTQVENESSNIFLQALDQVLRQVIAVGGDLPTGSEQDVIAWQGAVSSLRRHLLPYLDDDALLQAEDLWQQARVLIGGVTQRVQDYQSLLAEQRTETLQEIGEELITTFDMEELMDVLAEGLPHLGIPSAYLSLYEDPEKPIEWSRLILAYNKVNSSDPGRVELEDGGRRFRSRQLTPAGMLPDRQYSFVVEPLYFREHQLGFALFEVGPREGTVYDVLRGEISSALQGALLLREREDAEKALEKAYAEVELQVEERTAELQREIEERERAQEENLRLQQEIIESQKHALQELSTPVIPILEGIIVMPLIGSIDTLRARDITRRLLAGVREHHAKVVILDITGVPIVDSGVASHLNRTIQAARLKGARTIVTGISEAVAETIVDLGIDWSGIETLSDLRTGLQSVLARVGVRSR